LSEYYSGVGSRETPPLILLLMKRIAEYHYRKMITLRSGHAPGADRAFEHGAHENCQIFLPWSSFEAHLEIEGISFDEPTEAAMLMAAKFHPVWNKLAPGAKKLHARNCHQVLGPYLDSPSKYVICWTPGGVVKGGTATAIKIAEHYHIPVFNLANTKTMQLWMRKTSQ
jgi:hypothetical protein